MFGGGALRGVGNGSRMRTKNNKRRFSDEQIKSLESIFDKEPKLEPRKKVEVARELGLQPRQVAIWFQNKRARWRSRQLESDFSLLRSNYDSLSSRFDSLNKDKHSLLLQLHNLKQLLGTSTQLEEGTAVINDRESQTNNMKQSVASAEEQKPTEEGSEYGASDDGCSHQTPSYFPMNEATPPGVLPMVEPTCSSLTSEEEWQTLHPQAMFDRSTTSCDWWDLPFVDAI